MTVKIALRYGFHATVLVLAAAGAFRRASEPAQKAHAAELATSASLPPLANASPLTQPLRFVTTPTVAPRENTTLYVDRSLIDKPPPAQTALLRSVRIVPEQINGSLAGVRLYGIHPGNLLGMLGLKNGDRVESVNGFNIADPEKALEAYARLRTASQLRVHVNRGGTPLDIDLNII